VLATGNRQTLTELTHTIAGRYTRGAPILCKNDREGPPLEESAPAGIHGHHSADNAPDTEPEVLKVAEVAQLLSIGERQAREAMIRGEVPCHRIGSQ
jgi:hypothetical protein